MLLRRALCFSQSPARHRERRPFLRISGRDGAVVLPETRPAQFRAAESFGANSGRLRITQSNSHFRQRRFYFSFGEGTRRRAAVRDLLLRHRHLLQHRRLQTPIVFAAGMARDRRDPRVVDSQYPAAGVPPRRALDIRRAMRRAGRIQLHLYPARGSARVYRRFISTRRRGDRARRRARPTRSIFTDSTRKSRRSCSTSIATRRFSTAASATRPPASSSCPPRSGRNIRARRWSSSPS